MKIAALLIAALALAAGQTARAASGSAEIGPKTKTYMPPGVKSVAINGQVNATAAPGSVVQIECALGYVGDKKYDANSPQAAYLAANNYSLPIEIRVHNTTVFQGKVAGLKQPLAFAHKTSYQWPVGQPYAGKSAVVECRVDPANVIHASSQKAYLTVTGTPQQELTTRQPGGDKVMANPKPVLPPATEPKRR